MAKRKDQRAVAEGLARGLGRRDALRRAGYAESTIQKVGYQIVRRPLVQSALTDALEREGVTLARIIKPYVDGLDAMLVVKSAEKLKAEVTTIPDLAHRKAVADELVKLFGGIPREVEMPPLARPRTVIVINRTVHEATGAKIVQGEVLDTEPLKSNGHGGRTRVLIARRENRAQ